MTFLPVSASLSSYGSPLQPSFSARARSQFCFLPLAVIAISKHTADQEAGKTENLNLLATFSSYTHTNGTCTNCSQLADVWQTILPCLIAVLLSTPVMVSVCVCVCSTHLWCFSDYKISF